VLADDFTFDFVHPSFALWVRDGKAIVAPHHEQSAPGEEDPLEHRCSCRRGGAHVVP
jgi:hypothetical protein